MAKLKVSLSIGFPTAKHHDVIEVEDDPLTECETEDEKDDYLHQCWQEWASNYIQAGYEIVE